ncbi:hypothetical protein K438DRAFT_1949861 [Mycena galopus ATCC 62051]|nr:hypothetical protein K438DRAFT_1949861 [Mycena galopus ATCC 62051]
MSLYVLCLECKKQIPAALCCRGTRDVTSTCAQLPVLPGLRRLQLKLQVGSSVDWLGLQHKSRRGQQGSLPAQRGSSSPMPLPQVIDPVLTLSLPTPPTPASGTSLAGRGASATHMCCQTNGAGCKYAHRNFMPVDVDGNPSSLACPPPVIPLSYTGDVPENPSDLLLKMYKKPMDEAWAKQYMQAVQKRKRIQTEADQKRVEAQRAQHQIHVCYFHQDGEEPDHYRIQGIMTFPHANLAHFSKILAKKTFTLFVLTGTSAPAATATANATANGAAPAVNTNGAAAPAVTNAPAAAADSATATAASSPTGDAATAAATATDGSSNNTGAPPAATAGTDSQTLTTATGASAVPTVSLSGTGTGSGSGAAIESSSTGSSFLRTPAFIGVLTAVGVLLALGVLFLVLRCRRRRARARAARYGHKLDAEMDAVFHSTLANENEKALDVDSGAGGELSRAQRQSTLSTASYMHTLPPLALAGTPEQEPQYNFFAQQGPYSAAPDHTRATASRRGSAYLSPTPTSANSNGSGGREPDADEPAFEMVTPAVGVAVSQAQGQYPAAGPARAELHCRPTVTVPQPHVYPAQEHAHAHRSGLAQRPSLTAVIHLSRPASPANPFADGAEGEEKEEGGHGRAMTEIPLSPAGAYPNPYDVFAAYYWTTEDSGVAER